MGAPVANSWLTRPVRPLLARPPWVMVFALSFPIVMVLARIQRDPSAWGYFTSTFPDSLCYIAHAYALGGVDDLSQVIAFTEKLNTTTLGSTIEELNIRSSSQCASVEGRFTGPLLAALFVPIAGPHSLLIVNLIALCACSWLLSLWFCRRGHLIAALLAPVLLLGSSSFWNWGFSGYPSPLLALLTTAYVLSAMALVSTTNLLWLPAMAVTISLGNFTTQSWPIWLSLSALTTTILVLRGHPRLGALTGLLLVGSSLGSWRVNSAAFGEQNAPESFRGVSVDLLTAEKASASQVEAAVKQADLSYRVPDFISAVWEGIFSLGGNITSEVLKVFGTDPIASAMLIAVLVGLFKSATRIASLMALCLFLIVVAVAAANGQIAEFRWGLPFIAVSVLPSGLLLSLLSGPQHATYDYPADAQGECGGPEASKAQEI